MTSKKREFIDAVEELMDQGHQIAIPVKPEDMDMIRRSMKKSIDDYNKNNNHKKDKAIR